MKKVLIITYYWPPCGGVPVQRTLKFVKYLQNFGWQPIVYTVLNGDYLEHDHALVDQIPSNIDVIKKPIWEPHSIYRFFMGSYAKGGARTNQGKANKLIRTIKQIAFFIRGIFFIPDTRYYWIRPSTRFLYHYLKTHSVDAIISTGPPHSTHLIACQVSKLLSLPWLADFRDPWTTMDYYADFMLIPWADKKHHALERKVVQSANTVVVIGDTMKKEFEAIGARRVSVITNGFDEDDFYTSEDFQLDKEFTWVHTGTFSKRRNPVALWKAIATLKATKHPAGLHLKIKLIGKVDSAVIQSLHDHGLYDQLQLIEHIAHRQAIYQMKSAQILLLLIDDFSASNLCLPAKLYEYLASKRPIVCIGPLLGDTATTLNETQAGVVFSHTDVEKIKNHIMACYDKFAAGELLIIDRDVEKYSRRFLTQQLANELNQFLP